MKVLISIENSDTKDAVPKAKAVLRIDNKAFATVFTGYDGKADHEETRTTGKILSWVVEAEGFEVGEGELEIDKPVEEIVVYLVPKVVEPVSGPVEEAPIPPPEPRAAPPRFLIEDEAGKPLDGANVILEHQGKRVGAGISTKGVVIPSGALARLQRGQTVVYRVKKVGFHTTSGEFELGGEGGIEKVTLIEATREKWPLRRVLKWAMISGSIVTALLLVWDLYVLDRNFNPNRDAGELMSVVSVVFVTPFVACWIGLTLWAFLRAKKL